MSRAATFWSVREVAEFLEVSEHTVRYWLWQGTGPESYKFGRARKFKPADVKAWAASRGTSPAGAVPSRRDPVPEEETGKWTSWLVATSECPTCSALVPDNEDSRLNHERWHAR